MSDQLLVIVREVRRTELTPIEAIRLGRETPISARAWMLLAAAHKVVAGEDIVVEIIE